MSTASALADALMKSIGENSAVQEVTNFLNTGYLPLNEILSGSPDGGLPYGRIIEMYGPPSAGKTALATALMISAQQAGGIAMFMDHEYSFDVGLAKEMGLKDEFPFWIYKRPKTWEESNTTAMKAAKAIRDSKAIPPEAPIVIVFDSVAAMIPRSVFEKGIEEYSMNDTTALARVTSTTLKAVNQVTSELNVCMIYLNQIRTKPGVVYGDPTGTPGGQAMEFYASIRIALGRKRVMEEVDGEKEMTAQVISIKTTKNKVNRPFKEIDLRMRFLDSGGARFDKTTSLIELLVDKGMIKAAGPRITWTDGKSYFKKQLIEKVDSEGLYPELEAMYRAAKAPKADAA